MAVRMELSRILIRELNSYQIIELRERHGLTQADLAERCGIDQGDISRIERQQYFLSAAFRKIVSQGTLLNPFKLKDLVTAVSSSLTVDKGLEGTKLLSLATQMSALTAGNLVFVTAPNNPDAVIDGLSVVLLDMDQLHKDVATFIGHPDAYTTAAPAAPSTVTVSVVNNTSGGVAGDVAVTYPPGQEAQAKAVAAVVPSAAVVSSSEVSVVTLVLGNDGVGVTASSGGGAPSSGPTASSSAPVPDPGGKVRTGNDADCVD